MASPTSKVSMRLHDFALHRRGQQQRSLRRLLCGPDGIALRLSGLASSLQVNTEERSRHSQQGTYQGVNKAGVYVGDYVARMALAHGMMISGSKVKNIDDQRAPLTTCFGINSSTVIVVALYDNSSGNPHGFEYTAGKFKDIPGPAGAISSDALESTTPEISLERCTAIPPVATTSDSSLTSRQIQN